jgi:hypothetical protein
MPLGPLLKFLIVYLLEMDALLISFDFMESVKNERSFSSSLPLSGSMMVAYSCKRFVVGTTALIPFCICIGDGYPFHFVKFDAVGEK